MRPELTRALLGLVAAGVAGCPLTQQTLYGGPPLDVIDEVDEVDEVDVDGDGYGTKTDCDDSDASVHPGAEDATADGKDQDCDGHDGPKTPEDAPTPELKQKDGH